MSSQRISLRNTGAAAAHGDHLVFIDADVEFKETKGELEDK
ncbi:hypothetical protein Aple_011080 [Acrocarpospora pleiomorpha]|uniref:Glycosyltransferase 2-like domain-containing protein n=1 Tax=Acrocarpospora pleiomorpha TaxID=90975 RepID=A0A5M3XGW4_9ACTN|nr:hypothetical protein [Acrocarpospora pleiomorpha]GES18213.1 hypothetical protein Aple_011080 [Acrocarpospora pleiomorpha]